jgi:hypothetical protein
MIKENSGLWSIVQKRLNVMIVVIVLIILTIVLFIMNSQNDNNTIVGYWETPDYKSDIIFLNNDKYAYVPDALTFKMVSYGTYTVSGNTAKDGQNSSYTFEIVNGKLNLSDETGHKQVYKSMSRTEINLTDAQIDTKYMGVAF